MLRALIKTMRPRQWTKNAVVFAALVFDRQLSVSNPISTLRTLVAFFLFCLVSGVVYIINDLADVEADRLHPIKKNRPIASGRIPVKTARFAVAVILLISFPISYILSPEFCLVCIAYLTLNLAYSFKIKHIPLLDVMAIAAGFLLRVLGGVVLIHVERFSPWLYIVITLLSLYIGFGKRRAELAMLDRDSMSPSTTRRVLDGYTIPFLDQMITVVSSATIIAYSLYTFSAPNLPANHTMMLTIPFVLYGVFRYLYLIQVKHAGGAPEELLLTDRPLQAAIVTWGAAVLFIFYFVPLE